MRFSKRWMARATATAAGVATLAMVFPAGAHDPGPVAVSKVSGGRTVTAKGSAKIPATPPKLVVDAGDSTFLEANGSFTLTPIVSGASGPIEHKWSGPGKLTVAPNGAVTVDTKGVAGGTHAYRLDVTDKGNGATGSDSVKVVVVAPTTLVNASKATTVGLPDENAEAPGAVDGQSSKFPFTVAPRTRRIDLTLDWGQVANDYDVHFDDPSDANDALTSGATTAKPEVMSVSSPAVGKWSANVDSYLTIPDTYKLTVTGVVTPDLPSVSVGGPYNATAGSPVTLKAAATGGKAPLSVAWDLDQDGTFESKGNEVTSRFPFGGNLVTAKVIDADGFENRQVTAVRVAAPGVPGKTTPIVTVAINDSGVNPYHDEFSAKTFPDERILALTDNFRKHPSEYITGYPKESVALNMTIGKGYLPKEDEALWTQANIPVGRLNWIPGTKLVGAIDGGNGGAANGAADVRPIIDEDGHGTASASVAVGNTTGYCPTCVLVFSESLSAKVSYDYPWVDIVSTSGSPLFPQGPVVTTPLVKQETVERGQTVLFAAGNGNEGAFVTPNDTYKSQWAGPDWIIRVGAADSKSRKPILGDGNPVDVTSYGYGPIPSADIGTTSGLGNHSGTSAATPITAGVFGSVLSALREALGDTKVGQKAGVVASGNKLSGPYLSDGVLTRAELFEIVFKTAQPSTTSDIRLLFPQVPYTQFHYVTQGYGIADFASTARAIDVGLGKAPLPVVAPEDAFLAADSDLRVRIWGSWKGAKPAKALAAGKPAQAGADTPRTPFDGVGFEQVGTLDKSLPLIADHVPGAFRASSTASGASASAASQPAGSPAFTSPVGGATVDTSLFPNLAVTGTATGGVAAVRPPGGSKKFFLRREGCGVATGDNQRLSQSDGPDPGGTCGLVLQSTAPTGVADFEEIYAAADGLPLALDPAKPVKGTIFIGGSGLSPMHTITIGLYNGVRVIGQQTVTKSVVGVPRTVQGQPTGQGAAVPFDFSFTPAKDMAGKDLKALALKVTIDVSGGLFYNSMDNPASFVEVPILAPAVASSGSVVQVSVDDPTFKTPAMAAVAPDGAWGTNVNLEPLRAGSHILRARVVNGSSISPVSSLPFTITRTGKPVVQVQLVASGQQPVEERWIEAIDTSKAKNFSTWSAKFTGVNRGRYDTYARILVRGSEVARSSPKPFTRR